ncbi:MAG: hypothetical protein UFD09_13490, partial [Prevotella sp.]|nr:hypothetical protein [Prevotella sp.]
FPTKCHLIIRWLHLKKLSKMTFSSGLSKLSFSGVKELSLPNVFCFYHASYFYQRKYIIKKQRSPGKG